MTTRDEQDLDADATSSEPRPGDDRRGDVKPTDNPIPRSPEPEEDAVREGVEKLDRLKPY